MTNVDQLEVLTEEFLNRMRKGEEPSVAEYAEAHPALAEEISECLPIAMLMERLKRRKSFGRVGRGGGMFVGTKIVKQLGDYRIIREIGRGGMGVVYEAEQVSLGRHVALKVLNNPTSNQIQVQRFRREALAAARLHHTNIVSTFGVGEQHGVHYLVMQLIDGVGLDRVLTELSCLKAEPLTVSNSGQTRGDRPPLSPASTLNQLEAGTSPAADSPATSDQLAHDAHRTQPRAAGIAALLADSRGLFNREYWRRVATIGRNVATALQFAHQAGVLHRDIKPGNLILDQHLSVWITDFGLARLAGDEQVSLSGDVIGTLRYMSPEQFDGSPEFRSDIFSLGLTLYELLTLRPAFARSDRASRLRQLWVEPVRPRKHSPHIPRDLETIILKAIARDPVHRYATAEQMAGDFQRFLDDRPIHARRAGPVERLWRWCRRNPAVAVPTTVAAMLLALVTTVACLGFAATRSAWQAESLQRQRAEEQRKLAEVNLVTAQANFARAEQERARAHSNLEMAHQERRRAEANLTLSLEALEAVFDKLAPLRSPLPRQQDADETFEPEAFPAVSQDHAELLSSLLKFYDRFAQQNKSASSLRDEAAEAHRRVADIHQRLGQFHEAGRAYGKALAMCQQAAHKQPIHHPAWTRVASLQNSLGVILKMTGNYGDAHNYHRQALAIIREQLKSSAKSTQINLELIRTHNLLGYAIWFSGSQDQDPQLVAEAERSHRVAITLLHDVLNADPFNSEYKLMLARSYRHLGPVLSWFDRVDEAIASNKQALRILEELAAEHPALPLYRYELMRACSELNCRFPKGDGLDEAKQRMQRALQLAKGLVNDFPTVSEYSGRAAYMHYKIGQVLARQECIEEAEESYRTAVSLQETQVRRFPSAPIFRLYLAMARYALVKTWQDQGRLAQARELANISIRQLEPLPAELKIPCNQRYTRRLLAKQERVRDEILQQIAANR